MNTRFIPRDLDDRPHVQHDTDLSNYEGHVFLVHFLDNDTFYMMLSNGFTNERYFRGVKLSKELYQNMREEIAEENCV